MLQFGSSVVNLELNMITGDVLRLPFKLFRNLKSKDQLESLEITTIDEHNTYILPEIVNEMFGNASIIY